MKKKILFISMLSLMTVMPQTFAETAYEDTPVREEAPELNLETPKKKEHKRFFHRVKKVKPNKEQNLNLPEPNLGREAEFVLIDALMYQPSNELVSDNNNFVQQTSQPSAPAVSNSDIVEMEGDVKGSVAENKIISVDECIRIALENNPTIANAMSTSDIYKTKIGQAWSSFFPTFSASLGYSGNEAFSTAGVAHPKTNKYHLFYAPQLSANMLLFDFGKTSAVAGMAKKVHQATELDVQTAILNVVYNVKAAYYNLLFALQQEQVYTETVKDFEMHLKQAQAYYDIGTKPKIDVLTAEYNLGNAKLNLLKSQNTVKVAYAQLANVMGLPEFSNFTVKDDFNMFAYDIELEQALKTAYESRPSLLSAKKRADASHMLVKSSVRAFTPDIGMFASYSRGGRNPDTDTGYQVGGQIAYSGVNLLYLKKQVDEAKATYKRDLSAYEVVKQQVYLEVKEGYLDLVNAQDSIDVARLSMNSAKEQYDMASGRYKVGLGTAIELKDAETTYRNAQLKYYSTLLDYHVSAANLENMIGAPIKSSDEQL